MIEYSSPRNIVTSLCCGRRENLIYQGAEDLCVRVWNNNSSLPCTVFGGYVYFPLCLALDKEENVLATGCKGFNGVGCGLVLWDVRQSSQPLAELSGHSQDVTSCAFIPTFPGWLATCSKDGTVRVWDTQNRHSCGLFSLGRPISSLCILGNDLLGVAMMDGSLSIIRCKKDAESQALLEEQISTMGVVA